jgi:hypothetical protein
MVQTDQYPQQSDHKKKSLESALTGLMSESANTNLASEMLKGGKEASDALMRTRLGDEDDLLAWLDYVMCVERYEMSPTFMRKAQLYIAGLVGVDGVGRKEAVQMVTGVLHHALYDEKTSNMKKWKPWRIMGSGDKDEEQRQ